MNKADGAGMVGVMMLFGMVGLVIAAVGAFFFALVAFVVLCLTGLCLYA